MRRPVGRSLSRSAAPPEPPRGPPVPPASAAGASEPPARLIAPGDGAPSTPIARDDAQSPLPDAWK
ncbi:hypothetical protein DIS09_19770 [Burkholderia pseudomallei]|nr:hypothetical protein DIS09_19770 [Burkholderia pseudomallei]